MWHGCEFDIQLFRKLNINEVVCCARVDKCTQMFRCKDILVILFFESERNCNMFLDSEVSKSKYLGTTAEVVSLLVYAFRPLAEGRSEA